MPRTPTARPTPARGRRSYSDDFPSLRAYIESNASLAGWEQFGKPIWLTEFALANFGGSPETPTDQQQAAFLTAATAMLQRLPYVQRYAWFGLQATPTDGSIALFGTGPVAKS